MLEIGALEAGDRLGALLDRVEGGEEIVITRLGKPVARLVPSGDPCGREEVRAAAERILARAALAERGGWAELKQDRDEGRP